MKKERTRRLFPETFEKIQFAKSQGIPAEDVWKTMEQGAKQSGMTPSCQAAASATYQEYIIEIYGKRATTFLREKTVST